MSEVPLYVALPALRGDRHTQRPVHCAPGCGMGFYSGVRSGPEILVVPAAPPALRRESQGG